MSEVQRDRATRPATSRPPVSPVGRGASEPINLADLLERVLDKGIVIAGDVKVIIGDIELLTIKIRLLIASVDKAQEIGINWWQSDPMLSAPNGTSNQQHEELMRRLERIEQNIPGLAPEESREQDTSGPALSAQNRELRHQRDELQKRLEQLEARLATFEERAENSNAAE